MKNDVADTQLDGKPVSANHTEPVRSRPLKNWKHEKFANLVVAGTEAGKPTLSPDLSPIARITTA